MISFPYVFIKFVRFLVKKCYHFLEIKKLTSIIEIYFSFISCSFLKMEMKRFDENMNIKSRNRLDSLMLKKRSSRFNLQCIMGLTLLALAKYLFIGIFKKK